jgi:hypothetical protein
MGVSTTRPSGASTVQQRGRIQALTLVELAAAAAVVAVAVGVVVYALTRPPGIVEQTAEMTETANSYTDYVSAKGSPNETDCTVLASYLSALQALTQSQQNLPASTLSDAREAMTRVETHLAEC